MKKIISIILVLVIALSFSACVKPNDEKGKVTTGITKITDYLYEAYCDNYEDNFAKAQEFFEKYKVQLGGCSAVQVGVLRGRNYDWTYDETSEFVIHVPANENRYASVGVAAATLKMSEIDTNEYFDFYDILPYCMVDGINDQGLIVNINIVNYGEKGIFEMKTEDTSDDICPVLLCRLLLDSCATIEDCINSMNAMDIFSLGDVEEAHLMISGKQSKDDETMNTVVVELIPDENHHYQLSVIDYNAGDFVGNKPIMTNFHLTDFDGSVESLTAHPMGYERWQILYNSFDEGATLRGMKDLMRKVYYTNNYDLYSNNFWYSELTSGDLTMDKRGEAYLGGDIEKAGAFAKAIEEEILTYTYSKRGESTLWHTVHTSIYDYEDYHLYILPQESGYAYSFDFEGRVNIEN